MAPSKPRKPYLILSLDGGGIRGVLTAGILECLESDRPFLSEVQLIAGTSTGGILGLALASGMTPEEVKALYIRCGEKIFKKRPLDQFFDQLLHLDVTIFRAKYANTALREELTNALSKRAPTLADLQKNVLISTFNLEDRDKKVWKAKYFNNYPGDKDCSEDPVAVALRTSAAPTYFPSFETYIDGGVVSNNPSMCAVAQALHSVEIDSPAEGGHEERLTLNDIYLISVGTGNNPKKIIGTNLNWGFGKWWKPLYDVLMDGSVDVADYHVRNLLGDHYARINFPFPNNEAIDMDDVTRIKDLENWATQTQMQDALNVLDRYYEHQSRGRVETPAAANNAAR